MFKAYFVLTEAFAKFAVQRLRALLWNQAQNEAIMILHILELSIFA